MSKTKKIVIGIGGGLVVAVVAAYALLPQFRDWVTGVIDWMKSKISPSEV